MTPLARANSSLQSSFSTVTGRPCSSLARPALDLEASRRLAHAAIGLAVEADAELGDLGRDRE